MGVAAVSGAIEARSKCKGDGTSCYAKEIGTSVALTAAGGAAGKVAGKLAKAGLAKVADRAFGRKLDTVRSKIPSSWGEGEKNAKKVGWRWRDPEDQGNGVRVDRGDPDHPFPSQREDHVRVDYRGKPVGRDGKPISGSVKQNHHMAHIPLRDYLGWRSWFRP